MVQICAIGEADPFIAHLLQRFAEESGLRTVRAQLGQELLELVRRVRPAVVVLEVELPGNMRGWEVIQALKADPALVSLPIITCSWLTEAEKQARVGPTADHLQKPDLHYEDFVAALRKVGLYSAGDIHQPKP